MSEIYRATFNVTNVQNPEDTYAAALSTVSAHCIVTRSHWYATGAEGVITLTFVYHSANDNEARKIIQDAGQATGLPFDAVTILAGAKRRELV